MSDIHDAWAKYTLRFADPDDSTRQSKTAIRDAFEAGYAAAEERAERAEAYIERICLHPRTHDLADWDDEPGGRDDFTEGARK